MADAVTSQTLADGQRMAVFKFTNISDGTGESGVTKIDVSALSTLPDGRSCTGVSIDKIWWQCNGMKVQILWEATADQFCIELGENQSGYHDYRVFGGLTNNAGSGKTGAVAFTTVGHTGGDTYTVIIECTKTFA